MPVPEQVSFFTLFTDFEAALFSSDRIGVTDVALAPWTFSMKDGSSAPIRSVITPDRISKSLMSTRAHLFCVCVAFVAICLPYLDVRPIFDAALYFDAIQTGVASGFQVKQFVIAGHFPGYLMLLAFTQLIAPGSATAINIANVVLAIGSIFAFYGVLLHLFHGAEYRRELPLVVALFAFLPAFVVNVFHISPDFGVLAFFVYFLYFLISERLVFAALCGTMMILSKENSVVLYVAAVLSYYTLFVTRSSSANRFDKLRLLWARKILLLPLLFTVATYYYLFHFGAAPVESFLELFHESEDSSVEILSEFFLHFDLSQQHVATFCADIFLVSFNWLLSLVVLVWIGKVLVGWFFGERVKQLSGVDGRGVALCAFMLLVATYYMTRWVIHNNIRYVLPAFPLFIIVYYAGLASVFRSGVLRKSFLTLVLILLGISNFKSIDPVTEALFSVVSFGEHQVFGLKEIGSQDKDVRDPLYYNLQALNLNYLIHSVLEEKRFTHKTPLFAPAFFRTYAQVLKRGVFDASGWRSSQEKEGVILIDLKEVQKARGNITKLYVLELPIFLTKNGIRWKMLDRAWKKTVSESYNYRGYQLIVHTLIKKNRQR